jgi:hypothetical protein
MQTIIAQTGLDVTQIRRKFTKYFLDVIVVREHHADVGWEIGFPSEITLFNKECVMYRSVILVAAALLLCVGGVASGSTVAYSFDSDPSWSASGNRPGDGLGQDFGFSNTNYAGGGSAGEIGGVVDRSGTSAAAYYGVNTGSLDLTKSFEMNWNSTAGAAYFYGEYGSGKWRDQSMFLGFYSSSGTLTPFPVQPAMGVLVSDHSLYTHVACGSAVTEDHIADFNINASHIGRLRMLYDPNASTYGTFSVNYDGTQHNFALTQAQRANGASLDTFGFVSVAAASGFPAESPMDFYLDDLSVTGVPEPSTIVLFGTALCGLVAYAWRKRK